MAGNQLSLEERKFILKCYWKTENGNWKLKDNVAIFLMTYFVMFANLLWSTPPDILHSFREKKVWVATPQLYDLGRMSNFPSLSDLHDFTKQRSTEGCERCLPVILKASDCTISLFSGDSLYPEKPDRNLSTEKCLEELQKDSPNLHRIVYHSPYKGSVFMNITPKYKHLSPLTVSESRHHDNKL